MHSKKRRISLTKKQKNNMNNINNNNFKGNLTLNNNDNKISNK